MVAVARGLGLSWDTANIVAIDATQGIVDTDPATRYRRHVGITNSVELDASDGRSVTTGLACRRGVVAMS